MVIFNCALHNKAYADTSIIQARISASEIIIVDNNYTIKQIFRNAQATNNPLIRIDNTNGTVIQKNSKIMHQYTTLNKYIPTYRVGKVYDARNDGLFALLAFFSFR